jgi:AraC family transcriptional regulator, arabinose operon regulatory protein
MLVTQRMAYLAQLADTNAAGKSPPLGLLYTGYQQELPGYHIVRPRGTRDWLLTYTLAGQGAYRLGARDLRCVAGDAVLLPPGIAHDYFTPPEQPFWRCYWAHFTPLNEWLPWLSWARDAAHAMPDAIPRTAVDDSAARLRIEAAFARCLQDNASDQRFSDALAHAGIAEVLALIAQQQARSHAPQFDPRVQRVFDLLPERLAEPPSVVDLAKMVALSPSRLAHLFKQQTGESIAELQMKLRLRYAARELAFGARSVSEIASAVGFHSLFQFSRQFKNWYGESPSGFRRNGRRVEREGER